jgi:NAD(P)-dependent dehydrogenase (short-subunit alcohol dehydrogenase family)
VKKAPTVLVTGATGKLGRQFSHGFSRLGWNLAFTSRGAAAAEALMDECRTAGASDVVPIIQDLTAEDAAQQVLKALRAAEKMPDVLVNNARDVSYLRPDGNGWTPRAQWLGELSLAVLLPYDLTVALTQEPGSPLRRVINIGSMYGAVAPNLMLYDDPDRESPVNYGVAKAALVQLTRELAVRLAPRGVAVNAVSFGGVRGRAGAEFMERYARLSPSGRMLEEEEVFGAVRFLASEDASGITGHNLMVDGGWTAW